MNLSSTTPATALDVLSTPVPWRELVPEQAAVVELEIGSGKASSAIGGSSTSTELLCGDRVGCEIC